MPPTRARLTRWLVPASVVAVVLSVAGVRASVAGAAPSLPEISAANLLARVQTQGQQGRVQSLSGVVHTSTDLGLPALPDTAGALSPQALLAGQHTLRIFLDGSERQRVDLFGTLAGSQLVHNGRDVWQWSSTTGKATHTRLPVESATLQSPTQQSGQRGAPVGTPQELAARLLAAVEPTTKVTVGTAATVAGRSAYDLRLAPQSRDSLVARADVYVDAQNGVPLRVTVLARSSKTPAIDIRFDSVDFTAPAARVFRFAPPAGTKAAETRVPTRPAGEHDARPASGRPSVLGSGWTAVAEIRGTGMAGASGGQLAMLLRGAARVHGAFGSGRVVSTRLLTVLLTDDGRVFAGAVTRPALLRAASSAGQG